ncbi:TPA: recombinase family protein [Vibrio parahaemolyticus]|nr:recombinase family protein [Vibrio parahaemolyticus]HCE2814403.1 recombinase family protein [Vibrio parahaemolyticus]HCE2818698.1 recombinase family protein [Vibrio parahaemolyticus]HCG5303153.1 recombinase family protein [Vibrio parahaemolyticus]HCG5307346.1 recombinase family protein [Vibrio parahaemolyticus]
MTTAKAFLYIRFSSKRQELGDSIKRQTEKAEYWCNYNDVELSEQTFEDLGISAFKEGGKRPGLVDLIEAVHLGKIPRHSYILFEDTDRLTRRGFKHALDLVHELVKAGVYMVTLSNGTVYDSDNIQSLSSSLPLLLDADRAHLESQRKSMLIRAARKSERENREIKGKLPFWLKAVDGEAVFTEHKKAAELIVEYKTKGYSILRIARELNDAGIPSPNGKTWSSPSIRISIKNRALYGAKEYFEYKDGKYKSLEVVPNMFPPICDELTWLSIQPTKKSNNGARTDVNPLSKLIKCGKCGGGMQMRTSTVKGKLRKYRKCTGVIEGRCDMKGNAREIDQIILDQLKHLTFEPIIAKSDTKKELELEIQQLNELNEALPLTRSAVAKARLYDDIVEQEVKVAELKAKVEDELNMPQKTSFKKILDLPTVAEQSQHLRRLLDRIELTKLDEKLWKAEIFMRNRHRVVFSIAYKWQSHDILFKSDTEQMKDWLNDFV